MAFVQGLITIDSIMALNVDSNPSLSGGLTSPVGSFGGATDGSGLFYKAGASNTDWYRLIQSNDNVLSSQNIVVVKKNPAVGQFSTIEGALASITTNTSTNRFVISVGVGTFLENQLNMKPYVSVVGTAIEETIIKPAGNHDLFVFTDVFSELSFISLQDVPSGKAAMFCNDCGDYTQCHKVNFLNCDINVYVKSVTQDTFFYGEYLDFNGVYSLGLKVEANNGFAAFANVENYYNLPDDNISVIGNYVTGVGSDLHVLASGQLVVGGVGTAFYIQDGANIEITSTNIDGFDKGIHVGNVGSSSNIIASGIVSRGINTYDIQIEHASTTGTIAGAFDDDKVVSSSTGVGVLIQDTNDGALTVSDSINILFSNGTKTNISTLIAEGATCGVEEGGGLTGGGGFTVNIGDGYGYFEQFPDNDVIQRVDWGSTSILLTANVDKYIYFNSNAILTSNSSEPDTRYNILLGRVVTNSTGIEFIDASPSDAEHTSNLISNNLKNAIGAVYANGSIVTANVTPLKLNITAGEYYFGENVFMPSGASGFTFTSIYGEGSGVITGQTLVSNTQYDNAGTLTALTASYYAKHSIYLIGDGVNQKFYFVYAQNQYSTQLAAEQANIPLPPTSFKGSMTLVAGVIVQQGNANIVEIIDERPVVGFRASGVNASADHLSLLNLNTGNAGHFQFMMLNGSTPMAGNLDMGGNNVFNAGTYNGVTIELHGARHLPNGADPLTTAAPTTNLGGSSTNAVGIQNSFARSDHSHAIDQADTSTTGLLKSVDWNTFNSKIGGSGTINKYAKFTYSGVIGNGIISDDGTDATSTGILYFSNNKGIDVTATGGSDVLNIGTSNADVINIGWSGANINIIGNVFYENVTQLQVKDKLFTVNKGGAVGSGASAGFEIEEGGVITGQFSTSGTRDGFFLEAPAITATATLSLSSLSVDRTYTLPNATGTFALLDASQAITNKTSYNGLIITSNTGVVTTGTWNGTQIGATFGGTGQTVYAIGDLLYADSTTSLAKLSDVVTGNALISGGVSTAPSWGKIGLTTHVSGILPIANGGTGQVTNTAAFGALSPLTTKGDLIVYSTTNIRQAVGSNGQVLTADSTQASGVRWATPTVGTVTNFVFTNANGFTGTVTTSTTTPTLSLAAITSSQVTTALGYTPVNVAGDTMTGTLVLNADATTGLQAVTYQQLTAAVTGVYKLQGGYNPTVTSLYPVAANTTNPVSATVKQGMIWSITADGTINGIAVKQGDEVVALTDSPAQVNANWNIISHDIGYTPLSNVLNSANIFVGNGSNVATGVALSGDATINNTGALTLNTVSATKGGTGQTVYVVGDILSADTTTTLSKIADVATGNALISGGVGVLPSWGKIGLTTHVSGTLPIANGGTNSGTALNNNRIIISSAGAIVEHAAQTSTRVSYYGSTGLPTGASAFVFDDTAVQLRVGTGANLAKINGFTSVASEYALAGTSNNYSAMYLVNYTTDPIAKLDNGSTDTGIQDAFIFGKISQTPTIGSGQYIRFDNLITGGARKNIGQFGALITNITAGTYKSAFVWNTPNETDGSMTERMRIASSGALTLTSPALTGLVYSAQTPNIVNSNTVVSTITETNFTGTGITLVVPANSLKVGDRVKVTAYGIYSAVLGNTLNIRFKTGATVLLTTGARVHQTATVTTVGFKFEVILTVITIGAGGTVRCNMLTLYDETPFEDGSIVPSNGTHAFDTTASNTLQFSAQWGTSSASNSITIENIDWEYLRN